MLEIEHYSVAYGQSRIIEEMNFQVKENESLHWLAAMGWEKAH